MREQDELELRKELSALDSLLTRLMPEDDMTRLALDPKRQEAAAQMLGTMMMARELLARVRSKFADNGVKPRKPNKTLRPSDRQNAKDWLLKHLPSEPTLKAALVRQAHEAGGWAEVGIYHHLATLVKEGVVKVTKGGNSGERHFVHRK